MGVDGNRVLKRHLAVTVSMPERDLYVACQIFSLSLVSQITDQAWARDTLLLTVPD